MSRNKKTSSRKTKHTTVSSASRTGSDLANQQDELRYLTEEASQCQNSILAAEVLALEGLLKTYSAAILIMGIEIIFAFFLYADFLVVNSSLEPKASDYLTTFMFTLVLMWALPRRVPFIASDAQLMEWSNIAKEGNSDELNQAIKEVESRTRDLCFGTTAAIPLSLWLSLDIFLGVTGSPKEGTALPTPTQWVLFNLSLMTNRNYKQVKALRQRNESKRVEVTERLVEIIKAVFDVPVHLSELPTNFNKTCISANVANKPEFIFTLYTIARLLTNVLKEDVIVSWRKQSLVVYPVSGYGIKEEQLETLKNFDFKQLLKNYQGESIDLSILCGSLVNQYPELKFQPRCDIRDAEQKPIEVDYFIDVSCKDERSDLERHLASVKQHFNQEDLNFKLSSDRKKLIIGNSAGGQLTSVLYDHIKNLQAPKSAAIKPHKPRTGLIEQEDMFHAPQPAAAKRIRSARTVERRGFFSAPSLPRPAKPQAPVKRQLLFVDDKGEEINYGECVVQDARYEADELEFEQAYFIGDHEGCEIYVVFKEGSLSDELKDFWKKDIIYREHGQNGYVVSNNHFGRVKDQQHAFMKLKGSCDDRCLATKCYELEDGGARMRVYVFTTTEGHSVLGRLRGDAPKPTPATLVETAVSKPAH